MAIDRITPDQSHALQERAGEATRRERTEATGAERVGGDAPTRQSEGGTVHVMALQNHGSRAMDGGNAATLASALSADIRATPRLALNAHAGGGHADAQRLQRALTALT